MGEEEQEQTHDKMGDDSSEDEYELVPKSVDNYWLEDGDENPISFATLPFSIGDDDVRQDNVLFLRGTQDNGMRLFVKALAWRLELTKPAFQVRTEKYWIGLSKPRKSYEGSIRSIMIVAHYLNYALLNPDQGEKAAWNHVNDMFPSFEVRPNQNDLSTHMPLIQQLVTTEKGLAGSRALESVVAGPSKKKLGSSTDESRAGSTKRSYVSDDESEPSGDKKRLKPEVEEPEFGEEMEGFEEDSELEEIGDLSETVCSICDNGGDVICCDGPCMRSFHLNKGADGASDANCATLGFSKADVERMDKFFCPNCKLKQHQCYICGELGCSDEAAGAAQQVFMCDAAICGHFYHPDCVADMILRDKDQIEKDSLAESIKEGKGFVCPMHKCLKCGKGENKEDEELQFGVCRRCPRVWHRKCLPSYLLFEATDDEPQRAWDDLLADRILIYCKKHKINSKLGTPLRDHVKFPPGSLPSAKKPVVRAKAETEEKKRKESKADSQKIKHELVKSGAPDFKVPKKKSEADIPKRKSDSSVSQGKLDVPRPTKGKVDVDVSPSRAIKKKSDEHLRSKENESVPGLMMNKSKQAAEGYVKQDRSSVADKKFGKPPLPKDSLTLLLEKKNKPSPYIVAKSTPIDSEIQSLVDSMIERIKNTVTIESIQKKHDVPQCYRRQAKNPDKKYSLVKIESIIRGMRKALETLDSGGSIEDAQAKCSPAFVKHLEGCKTELKVYLSPFLHGSRYTSFGRHFTKTDKLVEIVDRAHWYVQSGDMVVDFCCGANEFSLLMRRKLQETGKKCDFKNFDIIQTKNDFNFEKKDWFQVKQDQLPDGNRLVMGLNPPFGVKGQLANAFIDHALKFRPKLIVLIVPKETERLDVKPDKYDLVWEDLELLKGHSFYLPGSVDINENPLSDWNAVAPPLFIWSRPDWTPRFKQIAQDQGHISKTMTSGPARYAGRPWIPPLRPVSPVLMTDILVDKKRNAPTLVEPRFAEETSRRQDVAMKEVTPAPSRLKEMPHSELYDKNEGPVRGTYSERPKGRKAESVTEGLEEDKKMEVTRSNRKEMDDSKATEKVKSSERQDRRMGIHKQRKKESPDRQRHSTETRQGKAANDRYSRGPDTKIDISKYNDQRQKSPERYRRNMESEPRGHQSLDIRDRHGLMEGVRSPDSSRNSAQGRNSPERYGQMDELQNEAVARTEQRKHSPEGYNWRERTSENSRLYSQGLKLPETYGLMSDPKNDTARPGERQETSHDRFEHSSVVDLEKHHLSSRDRKMDSFNDYNTLLTRVNIDTDYQDSTYRMSGATDSRSDWRPELQDPKPWSKYNYSGTQASEDLERPTGLLHKDYMDSSIQREATIYQDKISYMKNYSEPHDGGYRKMDYLDRENFSGRPNGLDFESVDGINRKRDYVNTVLERTNDLEPSYLRRDYTAELTRTQNYKGLDVQASGHFGEAPFERRNTDLFSSDLSGGSHGLQGFKYGNTSKVEPVTDIYSRYGIREPSDLMTTSSYNLSSSAGLLPSDRSFSHLQLPGREFGLSTNPSLTYNSIYGSLPSVQQPAMHLNEPSLHPSHGLFDTHQGRQHGSLPINSVDGRFTNQSRGQFSGGWIDD